MGGPTILVRGVRRKSHCLDRRQKSKSQVVEKNGSWIVIVSSREDLLFLGSCSGSLGGLASREREIRTGRTASLYLSLTLLTGR